MKSELQKAADRVRKLQESKPALVEAMKTANDMLVVRQQEMEQAAFNLRAAQREAAYAETTCREHERMLWMELEEARTLTYSGSGDDGRVRPCSNQAVTAAGPNPYYRG